MTRTGFAQIKASLAPANLETVTNILLHGNVLGIIEFSSIKGNYGDQFANNNIPYLHVCTEPFLYESYFEVWTSTHDTSYGAFENLRYATDGYHFFAAISMKDSIGSVDEVGELIYNQIFESIDKYGYPYICRVWNYVPFIYKFFNDTERYKLFCLGRAKAFEKYSVGTVYPAATGIGDFGDRINVCFLSTLKNIHKSIENPKQTPAYKYPAVTDLKPPSFSRGTYSEYSQMRSSFYVSGTASILGYKTVFKGDIEQQCKTTIKNIQCLISKLNMSSYGIDQEYNIKDLDCIKVYIKHKADFEVVENICQKAFSTEKSIIYLNADICREDLLVEIEGLIQI